MMTVNTTLLKITRIILIVGVATGLGACASSASIGPMSDISYPPVGAQTTSYLGDRLLEQGQGVTADVITVHSLNGKFARIQNQTFCRVPGSNEFMSFNGQAVHYLNFVGGTRKVGNRVEFKGDKGQLCLNDVWSGCFGGDKASFDFRANGICSNPNALQQVIEYNGKQGETLNFTYRTFYRGTMNSERTQDFTMDLGAGDTFNYKGARIQVDHATNQEISYRVLRNFSVR